MSPAQLAVLARCNTEQWNDYHALTLGLRWKSRDGGVLHTLQHAGPPDEYVQNFRHFTKVINQKCFGNAARRAFSRLSVIPVLEQDRSGRFHYHAAIDRPQHVSVSEFCDMISATWQKTRWGHARADIIQGADSGWTKYILKRASKTNWFDGIDWQNFHNPSRCATSTKEVAA